MDALAAIYERADAAIARFGCRCLGGGCCCRFDLAGHRLYVSTLELAMLLQAPPHRAAPPLRCPYQAGVACTARGRRPLGCRTFYCQGPSIELAVIHEECHLEIRRLHASLALPYRYGEVTKYLATSLDFSR